jgi:hypothetical protein
MYPITEQWIHEDTTHKQKEHTKHTQTHCKTLKHFKATFQNQFKGRGGGQRPFTQHCWQPRPQSLPEPPSFMFAPHHGRLTEIIDVHPTRRDPGITIKLFIEIVKILAGRTPASSFITNCQILY